MVATRFLLGLVFAAHGTIFAQGHDIYHDLTNTVGESCCHDTDCRPTVYRITGQGVQMLVNGDWIRVPASLIQYRIIAGDTGETAGGHWCGFTQLRNPQDEEGIHHTFCAVLPPSFAGTAR